MIEASVTLIDNGKQVPFYVQQFSQLPRHGEILELEDNAYEVVLVIHGANAMQGVDLYVKHRGKVLDLIERLH